MFISYDIATVNNIKPISYCRWVISLYEPYFCFENIILQMSTTLLKDITYNFPVILQPYHKQLDWSIKSSMYGKLNLYSELERIGTYLLWFQAEFDCFRRHIQVFSQHSTYEMVSRI